MEYQQEYVEQLRSVLQFLQDNGFGKAADAVYEQLNDKEGTEGEDSKDQQRQDSAAGPSEDYEEQYHATATSEPQQYRSRSAEPVLTRGLEDAEASQPCSPWLSEEGSLLTRRLSGSSRLYEDPDVDEYEGPEDPGYLRRAVSKQHDFIRYQLGLGAAQGDDSDGLGLSASGYGGLGGSSSGHGGGSPASLSSSASLSSPGGLEPGPGGASSSSGQAGGGARGSGGSKEGRFMSSGDDAWDAGPTDIVLAPPVTTPTRDSRRSSVSEVKPSLSRVESLSNSFIDDMESYDGASTPLSRASSFPEPPPGGEEDGGLGDVEVTLQPSPPSTSYGQGPASFPGIFDLGRSASVEGRHGSVAGLSDTGDELGALGPTPLRFTSMGGAAILGFHPAGRSPGGSSPSTPAAGGPHSSSSSSPKGAAAAAATAAAVKPGSDQPGTQPSSNSSSTGLPGEAAITSSTAAAAAAAADPNSSSQEPAGIGAEPSTSSQGKGGSSSDGVGAAPLPLAVEAALEGDVEPVTPVSGQQAAAVAGSTHSSSSSAVSGASSSRAPGRGGPPGVGGGGGGPGFSFPVTPPSAAEEQVLEARAERVFSTWASSHSRASLDAPGASDDDDMSPWRSSSKAHLLAHQRSSASNNSQDLSGLDLGGAGSSSGPAGGAGPSSSSITPPGGVRTSSSSSLQRASTSPAAAGTAAAVAGEGGDSSPPSSSLSKGSQQQQQQQQQQQPGRLSKGGTGSPLMTCLPPALISVATGSAPHSPSGGTRSSSRSQQQQEAPGSPSSTPPTAAAAAVPHKEGSFAVEEQAAAARQQQRKRQQQEEQQQQQQQQQVSRSSSQALTEGARSAPADPSAAEDEVASLDTAAAVGYPEGPAPRYVVDEGGNLLYEYDPDYIAAKYDVFDLRVVHRRQRTGFEDTKEFAIRKNDLIAGRYQVMDFLGSAAFSQAVQALDIASGSLVCLKIIKNNKDYLDQSLDEIKLLRYVNGADPGDESGIVRLYDFFYYREHLILVCELLRANLYEFQKYQRDNGDPPYFTLPRIQRIAGQVLRSLAFLHGLGLVHSDLKPENILIKSYSRCEVKVIDLGSSCFTSDHLSSYVQSRSYRAPEVILGLAYDTKIDIWSLGCILAELATGYVLLQNDSVATLLARLEGILGPIPSWMISGGRHAERYYTRGRQLYERNRHTNRFELLLPKRTSLRHRVPCGDEGFLDFLAYLLTVDPAARPTAEEALGHPWLTQAYPPADPITD